ncbi:hypothetical protein Sjap_016181 [Stephania japonica]|uniref:Alliinase C-terminal domain-containing protein n=1 Tax=Stephania japonica TaxID=461633 RepID=A0AAP0NT96_9MAGN
MLSTIEQSVPDVQTPSSNSTSESKIENYTSKLSADHTVNLDFGDPTLYEEYWKKMENKCDTMIPSSSSVSYFSDTKNFCWFLEPELETQIRKLHSVVGNAAIKGRHIVVGVGSSQLLSAALYALCPQDTPEPISVVSAVPYYSPYPALVDHLQSRLYKWAGDANTFNGEKPYIEIVCSPNNPDGLIKQAVVNKNGGKEIHDLAYYWPQYTAITALADHDLMLFTASKLTGHAGSRIGYVTNHSNSHHHHHHHHH